MRVLTSLLFGLLAFGCTMNRAGTTSAHVAVAAADPVGLDLSMVEIQTTLSPYGDWVQLAPYGTVWCPRGVPVDWRPYTRGYWTYTDCGLTWDSDWPWGWCCFHYGRWVYDADYGWVWIPGTVWGPAWVAWRSDVDDIGWCPLPPGAVWTGIGFSADFYTVQARLDLFWWTFVPRRYLLERRLSPHFHNAIYMAPRFPHTRIVTRFGWRRDRVVDQTFSAGDLTRFSGRRVEPRPFADVHSWGELRSRDREGGSLPVYRPRVRQSQLSPRPYTGRWDTGEALRLRQEKENKALTERHQRLQQELDRRLRAERADAARQRQRNLEDMQRRQREAIQKQIERENRQMRSTHDRQRRDGGSSRGSSRGSRGSRGRR